MMQQLGEMFPDANTDLVKDAVDSSITIEDAVDHILQNTSPKDIGENKIYLSEINIVSTYSGSVCSLIFHILVQC